MRLLSYQVQVGTTPTQILGFDPRRLHSVMIRAVAAIEIGDTSLSTGRGYPLSAGEAVGFDHKDFDMSDPAVAETMYIHAVASSATTVRVFGWVW